MEVLPFRLQAGAAYLICYARRAQLFKKKGDLRQALRDFDTLLAYEQRERSLTDVLIHTFGTDRPKKVHRLDLVYDYYCEEALLYAQLRNSTKAFECCDAAFALTKQDFESWRPAESYACRASVYAELDRWDEAIRELQQISAEEWWVADKFFERLMNAGKTDKVVLATTELIRANPADRRAYACYEWRGRAMYANGDYNGAIGDYTRVIESAFGGSADIDMLRCDAYLAKGDLDAAITAYTENIWADEANRYSEQSINMTVTNSLVKLGTNTIAVELRTARRATRRKHLRITMLPSQNSLR